MRRIVLSTVALVLGLLGFAACIAFGAVGGVGKFDAADCTTIASPVTGKSWCFDQTAQQLKVYDGSGWRADAAKGLGIFNVKDYGATGNGLTNDRVAIQAALTAAAAASSATTTLTLWFPQGTYLISATTSAPFTGWTYCLNWAGSGTLIIAGGGTIALNAHEAQTVMLALNKATGRVIVTPGMSFTVPARVNTTHHGPIAISVGENGSTADTGTLDELSVQGVTFTRPAFAVHGQGAKRIRVRENTITIQGGGLTVAGYAEAVNVMSAAGHAYATELLDVSKNIVTMDGTYSDHVVYALGQMGNVLIESNKVLTAPVNAPIKLDYGTGTPTFDRVSITGNVVGNGGEAVVLLSGAATAKSVEIAGNTSGTNAWFIYSEWHAHVWRIEGNYAKSMTDQAVLLNKNAGLSSLGTATIRGNNFGAYNTDADNQIGVVVNCALGLSIEGNDLTESAAGSGSTIAVSNHSWAKVTGNRSTSKTPLWTGSTFAGIDDWGNSWNARRQTFVMEITNDGGTIKHRFGGVGSGVGAAGSYYDRITGAAIVLTATPTGADGATDFAGGLKISSAAANRVIFNVAASQVAADFIGAFTITYNTSGTDILALPSIVSRDVNGTTRLRPELYFTKTADGAVFDLTAANIAAGKSIYIQFDGYLF